MEYDVFISHASENRSEVALPLANLLREHGVKVWLDVFELKLGDSLNRSIDRGLAQSRFGVVILSPDFFRKDWPQRELAGLVTRETGTHKVILPVWHNITRDEIARYSPTLADKLGVPTTHGLPYVAQQVLEVIGGRPLKPKKPIPARPIPPARPRNGGVTRQSLKWAARGLLLGPLVGITLGFGVGNIPLANIIVGGTMYGLVLGPIIFPIIFLLIVGVWRLLKYALKT